MLRKYTIQAIVATLILFPCYHTSAQIQVYQIAKTSEMEAINDIQVHLDAGYIPFIKSDSSIVFIRQEYEYRAIDGRFSTQKRLERFLNARSKEGWRLKDIQVMLDIPWKTSARLIQFAEFIDAPGDTSEMNVPLYDIKPKLNYRMIFEKPVIPLAEFIKVYREQQDNIPDPNPDPSPVLININTAPADMLMELPGIGITYAGRIVDYRTANGPFTSIEDITNVRGIGSTTFNNIKDFITVGE